MANRNQPAWTALSWRALIAGICLTLTSAAVAAEPAGIHVTGSGEVAAVPDMARLTFEARREGTDAAALKTELDEVTRAVLALTRELDIEKRDVIAAAVNIYPRYRQRDGESLVDGVIASRPISITLRQLDRMGELINATLARGVNGVNNVELDVSNRPALERQALDLAIDDAIERARQVAARFSVELGPLLDAGSSAPAVGPMVVDMRVAASPPAESFEPGELTIRRDISALFAIAPGATNR